MSDTASPAFVQLTGVPGGIPDLTKTYREQVLPGNPIRLRLPFTVLTEASRYLPVEGVRWMLTLPDVAHAEQLASDLDRFIRDWVADRVEGTAPLPLFEDADLAADPEPLDEPTEPGAEDAPVDSPE